MHFSFYYYYRFWAYHWMPFHKCQVHIFMKTLPVENYLNIISLIMKTPYSKSFLNVSLIWDLLRTNSFGKCFVSCLVCHAFVVTLSDGVRYAVPASQQLVHPVINSHQLLQSPPEPIPPLDEFSYRISDAARISSPYRPLSSAPLSRRLVNAHQGLV